MRCFDMCVLCICHDPFFLTCKALNRPVIFPRPLFLWLYKPRRMQYQIISMDEIQSSNGNQAASNDIVITAIPRKVREVENVYLIYSGA